MFRDLANRHGCRDLGLVRVLRAKVQPPEIPAIHVSPRFCPAASDYIFHTVVATTTDQQRWRLCNFSLSYILDSRESARQSISRYPKCNIQDPDVLGLGQRHTALAFGRDSAANSATMHPDWLLVSCPCRISPIRSHERLRADGRSADRRARTRLLRFKWLGSENQNQKTSCVEVSCPRQPSLLFRGLLPLLIYVPLLLSSRVIRIAFSAQNFCKSRRPNLNANSPRHSLPGLEKSSRDGRRTISHRRKPS